MEELIREIINSIKKRVLFLQIAQPIDVAIRLDEIAELVTIFEEVSKKYNYGATPTENK